ncbi:MAG: class I SAM-dependent methyltransferase, partial [Planctomycetes bacterium]|nr:class I SAM-dependent methyltransferase [Planctomycetota bacterium]
MSGLKNKILLFVAKLLAKRLGPYMVQKRFFDIFEENGFHVTPVHFYQPLPELQSLPDEVWAKESAMPGVDMNFTGQCELLETFTREYSEEYNAFPRERGEDPSQYYVYNGAFECVDGEILYSMVRHFKPRRMMEIGSGNTTYLSAQAVLLNAKESN